MFKTGDTIKLMEPWEGCGCAVCRVRIEVGDEFEVLSIQGDGATLGRGGFEVELYKTDFHKFKKINNLYKNRVVKNV